MAENEPSIGATSEWFTPPEYFEGLRTSPSHGENRGSSPLGSANNFNSLAALNLGFWTPSPTFLQWTLRRSVRRSPCYRPLEGGQKRLGQSPPSRHRCLLSKMTHARIAARTDPLFAAEPELHLALEHPHDLLICVTVRLDMNAGPDAPPYNQRECAG